MNHASAAPSGAPAYPFPGPPAHGAGLSVGPGVLWLRLPLPFKLDHINVWLLEDGEGWTLVDCGVGIEALHPLWETALVALTGGRPLRRILVTHHHPDHLGLARWLSERTGAPVWMTATELACARRMAEGEAAARIETTRAHYARHGSTEFGRVEKFEAGVGYRSVLSGVPAAIREVVDGETIGIGGRPWRAIVTGGHAEAHMSLYCEALGLLISGDQVLPTISSNVSLRPHAPDADPLRDWLAGFDRIDALPRDTLVLPSHGLPFTGLHDRTATLRDHHAQTFAQLRALCATQPRTAGTLVPLLFPRELDPLNYLLAFGETLAHLRCLERRGELLAVTSRGGEVEFSTAG